MKLLVSGDEHLDGNKTPLCRTDNFYQAQVNALTFMSNMMAKYNARHISAGDITDKATAHSGTEAVRTIDLLQKYYPESDIISGNHDQKSKSLDYLPESIIYPLISSGKFNLLSSIPYEIPNSDVVLVGYNYGQEIQHIEEPKFGKVYVAVYHGFVDEKENTLIGGLVAKDIVHEFHKDYDWIITADHHKPFTHTYEGCTLINTGSLLRLTASQKDYKPKLWLIDTETKEFEPIYLPIEEGVVSDAHLVVEKDRKDRIESFVVSMDEEYEITDSFKINMENYISENKYDKEDESLLINKNVELFINKSLEGEM